MNRKSNFQNFSGPLTGKVKHSPSETRLVESLITCRRTPTVNIKTIPFGRKIFQRDERRKFLLGKVIPLRAPSLEYILEIPTTSIGLVWHIKKIRDFFKRIACEIPAKLQSTLKLFFYHNFHLMHSDYVGFGEIEKSCFLAHEQRNSIKLI